MNRAIGIWKLLVLSVVLGAPIGYWLFSNHSVQPSAVYAQQVVQAQQARGGLEQPGNIAAAEQLSKVFRDVAKNLKPSVVSIKNVVERSLSPRVRGGRGLPPELELFFGRPLDGFGPEQELDEGNSTTGRIQNGLGSGVVIRSDGYILTNNHVVSGASVLEVVLSDERTFEAKVVGVDERTDLAVLKIDATGLVAAKLGRSSNMEVGDWVIAIGSPFGLTQTVTAGIVSVTDRNDQGITKYDNFIQTDAAVNPGNSGGPLVNLRGEVIGINIAIASSSGGYNGICFAVPSDTAQRVLDDLISKGRVTRGMIGILPKTLTRPLAQQLALPLDLRGALVASVSKGFPADKAGIKKGDVITAINGKPIVSEAAMYRTIGETKPGTRIVLTLVRNGKSSEVPVQVEELDEVAMQGSLSQPAEALGVMVGEVSDAVREEYGLNEGEGVEVLRVNRTSPIARRIPPGVVILSINGKPTNSPMEFVQGAEEAVKKGIIKMVVRDAQSDKTVEFRIQ
jgi:serine protease Do